MLGRYPDPYGATVGNTILPLRTKPVIVTARGLLSCNSAAEHISADMGGAVSDWAEAVGIVGGMIDPLTGYVRVKAICVFTSADKLLAIGDFDPTKQRSFWVPVGGRVEFGETSAEAIVREVREELSNEISDLRFLGVLENIFRFDGGDGHEIVFVYDARFADSSMYDRAEVKGMEGEEPFTARWIDPSAPENGWPLYPEGLPGLLNGQRP